MDFIFEIIFEIILEGMFAGAVSRKVPLIFRILLALGLFTVFGGIVALLFFAAICNQSILLGLIGIGVFILFIAGAVKKIKEIKIPGDP